MLPPARGMMLMTGPPTSAEPRPPDETICTSSALEMSGRNEPIRCHSAIRRRQTVHLQTSLPEAPAPEPRGAGALHLYRGDDFAQIEPAHVRSRPTRHPHSRDERGQAHPIARDWQRRDDITAQHVLTLRALDVDDRRLGRYEDSIRHRPDAEVSVDLSGERPFELNALAFEGRETGQREGHRNTF